MPHPSPFEGRPQVTADAANHLSGLTYDVSGNTLTDGSPNTYTYDGAGGRAVPEPDESADVESVLDGRG